MGSGIVWTMKHSYSTISQYSLVQLAINHFDALSFSFQTKPAPGLCRISRSIIMVLEGGQQVQKGKAQSYNDTRSPTHSEKVS